MANWQQWENGWLLCRRVTEPGAKIDTVAWNGRSGEESKKHGVRHDGNIDPLPVLRKWIAERV